MSKGRHCLGIKAVTDITILGQPGGIVLLARLGKSLEPNLVGILTDKSEKQTQGNPLMTVEILLYHALAQAGF